MAGAQCGLADSGIVVADFVEEHTDVHPEPFVPS